MTNQEFAELWRDIWFVHRSDRAGGIGHYVSQFADNGDVIVTCVMDHAEMVSITDGHPENAEASMHASRELTLVDVSRFYWSRYCTEEDATSAAQSRAKELGWGARYSDRHTIVPAGWEALLIRDEAGDEVEIDAQGSGPILPDFLMPLYAATRPFDKSLEWPVRFLAFDRSTEKRKWAVWSSHIRYAGRKGPTTGLSHTFESGNVGDGRVFSVWVDDGSRFIGSGDEREVSLVAEDEAMARAFLMAGRRST